MSILIYLAWATSLITIAITGLSPWWAVIITIPTAMLAGYELRKMVNQ